VSGENIHGSLRQRFDPAYPFLLTVEDRNDSTAPSDGFLSWAFAVLGSFALKLSLPTLCKLGLVHFGSLVGEIHLQRIQLPLCCLNSLIVYESLGQ
jgi:hypothetical protein